MERYNVQTISLRQVLLETVVPALGLLPREMDSIEARLALLVIGLQESRFVHRFQVLGGGRKGPARGFWQFEKGSRLFGGGVWGVYKHSASKFWLMKVCEKQGVEFHPDAIWAAIEFDDILACCVARLLLFTDPKRLPVVGDYEDLWDCYAKRTWRPGKPHKSTWLGFYQRATQALGR